jgi:hypothetical protein
MVDLSLASSYVPAFVCLVKCLSIVSLGYVFVPLGGLSVMGLALLLDRVFFSSDFILDVNSVVLAVLWALVSNVQRNQFGFHTVASLVLSVAWCCVAVAQLLRPGLLRNMSELYVYVVLGALVTMTFMPREPFAYGAARVFGFDFAVLLQVYWHISVGYEEPLVCTLFRYGFVLVAPPLVALVGAFASCVVVAFRWRPQVAAAAASEPDVETAAAVLREALASRKEKSGI